jgi:hypothetical protein
MHENPRTPEAQVALSLALWLIQEGMVRDTVSVSIDGAMVRVHGKDIFDPGSFLAERGWKRRELEEKWSGSFLHSDSSIVIEVHSHPGVGDVSALLTDGRRLIAECKEGNVESSRTIPSIPGCGRLLGRF